MVTHNMNRAQACDDKEDGEPLGIKKNNKPTLILCVHDWLCKLQETEKAA